MWIAVGMVHPSVNGTMRPEDVGSTYFDDMLSKSIFIHYNENEFVMHDLIHDLSILISQGECLRTSTNKSVSIPNTVRHLYAYIDGPCELSISGLKNLRTLILDIDDSHKPEQDSFVTEILKGMENLRILILLASNLSELPESIGKLLHLRYLSLNSSRIDALPKSMSRLYFLETMVCKNLWTRQLDNADGLGMLINLRHLFVGFELLDIIAGIGRLTSLQELSFNVSEDMRSTIGELGGMRELRSLKIKNIQNFVSREEVIQANLKHKVNLNVLSLSWFQSYNSHLNEDVLESLEPHSGLEELKIKYYEGTGRLPIWFRTQALSKLVRLKFHRCNFVHLPSLEDLPLLKYIDFRDMHAIESIIHECNMSSTLDAFPSIEQLSFKDMTSIEKWCLSKQPNKWMQCLKKLIVHGCPKLRILPPVPIGVKEVWFIHLGLNALPNLWNDETSKSGSLPALVVISIIHCHNLVSLTEGLLRNPERFVALKKLRISKCRNIINLPQGGFKQFISLKKLDISDCWNVMVQEECFLPSALEKLSISSCDHLDTTLPKALESVHSLIILELSNCANITSLPPKEVFRRWKTLTKLILDDCPVLASIESLLGLSFIRYLRVLGCPMLSRLIPSPLALKKDETEKMEDSTKQTSAQPQPPSPDSPMEIGETSAQEKPLLSVDDLVIDDPLLLSVEPIRSFSTIRKLTILSELYSLPEPELPPFVQELEIRHGIRRTKYSPYWPKVSPIPIEDGAVSIYNYSQSKHYPDMYERKARL